jgi:hypothetical protein
MIRTPPTPAQASLAIAAPETAADARTDRMPVVLTCFLELDERADASRR